MQLRHHNIQKKFKNRQYGTFHFYSAPLYRGQPPVQGLPEYFLKQLTKWKLQGYRKKKTKKTRMLESALHSRGADKNGMYQSNYG